jgi:ABC-type glutathione transport system ATPase component
MFEVRDLAVGFRSIDGVTPIVAGVSFDVRQGRITGIAGESGSGKTTALLSAIGYPLGGAVRLDGHVRLGDVTIEGLTPLARRRLWATRVSYVAQDAAGALNPGYRIGTQLSEVLRVNRHLGRAEARGKAAELLAAVRLSDAEHMLRRYPHQCSGS